MFASQTFFLSLICFNVFVVRGILLGFVKVFGLRFPRFFHWWNVKPPGGGGGGGGYFCYLARILFHLSLNGP